jgi:YD repeat-containing protein
VTGADPIDLSSGLLTLRNLDLSISGTRGALAIARVYRTLSTNSGAFGLGSETPYNYELDTYDPQSAQAINLLAPDGNQFLFSIQPNGTFVNTSVPWLQGAVLTATGPYPEYGTANVANLRFKDGTVWTFEVIEEDPICNYEFSGLASITDRFGNQTTLTRNCTQITTITDPVGRQLNLTYNGNNSITSITDPIGRTVSYTYNSSGTLATVTDPNGGVTSYQYDSQNRMTSMIDPRGVTMFQNTFDANGRVIQQVAADGGVYQFAYTLINPTAPTSPVMTSTLTDPLGNQTPTALIPKATPYRRPTLPAKRLPSTALRVPICC